MDTPRPKHKRLRYVNLFGRIENWPEYLLKKMVRFNKPFVFNIRGFEPIEVDRHMMGTFREVFLDDIYYRHIPDRIFAGRPDPLIFDIGANVGYFSLATFMKFPKSVVHSFEPHPFNFKFMQEQANRYGSYSWVLHKKAVGNKNGKIKLNTVSTTSYTSMATIFDSTEERETFWAESIDLDSFIRENIERNIDFMKIDCEGAEYDIVYNLSEETFAKIDSLCIETHLGPEAGQDIHSLNTRINQAGFETKTLEDGATGYIWGWKE